MSFDPVSAGIDLIKTIINKTVIDKGAAAAALVEVDKMTEAGDLQLALAQIGVNQEEAKSTNWFIAGARPALLWICVLDVLYETIIFPVIQGFFNIHSANAITITMPIMLTLIGARSFDKFKGTDTK